MAFENTDTAIARADIIRVPYKLAQSGPYEFASDFFPEDNNQYKICLNNKYQENQPDTLHPEFYY
jgi:hypothetical protein